MSLAQNKSGLVYQREKGMSKEYAMQISGLPEQRPQILTASRASGR